MARRIELKGIAGGLINSFVSRNNDINGYWALGVIFKFLTEQNCQKFHLNLLGGHSIPHYIYSDNLAKPYRDFLFKQASKKGFEISQIKKAYIELDFDVIPFKNHIKNLHHGNPFSCICYLVDDNETVWKAKIDGQCWKHDPDREIQSTRVSKGE